DGQTGDGAALVVGDAGAGQVDAPGALGDERPGGNGERERAEEKDAGEATCRHVRAARPGLSREGKPAARAGWFPACAAAGLRPERLQARSLPDAREANSLPDGRAASSLRAALAVCARPDAPGAVIRAPPRVPASRPPEARHAVVVKPTGARHHFFRGRRR